MKWGNATITRREEEKDGSLELFATIDESDTDFKKTAKITWICNDPATTMEVKMSEYDHLITKAKVEEADDIAAIFNQNSKFDDIGICEGICKTLSQGSYFQFERRGFYYVDKPALVGSPLSVNFVPDGKMQGMSVISHTVDAATTAKGQHGDGDKAAASGKMKAGAGEDGKLSKKAAKKAEKKAGK